MGADLGRTGVDGVFLGATYAAVRTFQRDHRFDEDGEVGPLTWAALVDATFTLGDRLLYLRLPYLHGADVRTLQVALNALGFGCGDVDGIFGAYSERAVRDFQSNAALAPDGIAGPDTVRALEGLRHVWSSKTAPPPAELHGAPARRSAVLREIDVLLASTDETAALAERLVNLAKASEPDARVRVVSAAAENGRVLVVLLADGSGVRTGTVEVADGGDGLCRRLGAAIASGDHPVVVLVDPVPDDEHGLQALAVSLLDGVCLGLAAPR
jgi:peptidoglycan hydrolase-like protein with peptidoglycan-binding domain